MSKDFSLFDVLKVLGRWKKHIIRTTIAVFILSIIGTLLMPNWYQSTATFYAAHPDLAKPEAVGGGDMPKFIYGTSDDLDRLFSLANSSEIKNSLIRKFNLYERYDIDSTSTKGPAKMAKILDKLYKTTRTKYDAMSLSMEDKDPTVAKDIVQAAREMLSEKTQQLVKRTQLKTLQSDAANIQTQEASLKAINDSLLFIKTKYGVFDSKTQGEVFAQMLTETASTLEQKKSQLESMKSLGLRRDSIRKVQAVIAGLESKKVSLSKSAEDYNKGILIVLGLEQAQRRMTDEVSLEKERYKKLKTSYENPFTALHIVEAESVPVEKSRPKRSIYVLGLTFLAFLLSCLGALLVDSVKEVNWQEIYNG